jgi:hypothetical protein
VVSLQLFDEKFSSKHVIALKDILKVSTSSQGDHLFVLHMARQDQGDDKLKKGDYMFLSEHHVEIITRLFTAYRKATNSELNVAVSDAFLVNIDAKGGTRMTFDKASSEQVSVKRHGRAVQVMIPSNTFASSDDAEGQQRRGGTARQRMSIVFRDDGSR